MVFRLKIREFTGFADGLDHDVVVLAAFRNPVHDQVGDGPQQLFLLRLRDVRFGGGRLDRRGQDLDLGQQRLLFLALGLRHLLAEDILFGAEVFETDQCGTPRRIRRDDRIHYGLVGAAGALAGTELVRIFAEVFYVDHQTRVSNPPAMSAVGRAGSCAG